MKESLKHSFMFDKARTGKTTVLSAATAPVNRTVGSGHCYKSRQKQKQKTKEAYRLKGHLPATQNWPKVPAIVGK